VTKKSDIPKEFTNMMDKINNLFQQPMEYRAKEGDLLAKLRQKARRIYETLTPRERKLIKMRYPKITF
jgi:hypothetical protein